MNDFDESFLLEPDMWFANIRGETTLESIPEDIVSSSWYTKNKRLDLLLEKSEGDLPDSLHNVLTDLNSQIQPDVQGISAIPSLNSKLYDVPNLCENIQLEEFVLYRNSLNEVTKQTPEFAEQVASIITYFDHVVESCDDNELDEAELEKLNELAGAIQGERE